MPHLARSTPEYDPLGSELRRNAQGDLYFSRVFHFDKSTGKKPQFYTVNVDLAGEAWLREQGIFEGDRLFSEQVWHLQNRDWLYTKKGTLPKHSTRPVLASRPAPNQPVRPNSGKPTSENPGSLPIQRSALYGGASVAPKPGPIVQPTRVGRSASNKLRVEDVKPFWRTSGADQLSPTHPANEVAAQSASPARRSDRPQPAAIAPTQPPSSGRAEGDYPPHPPSEPAGTAPEPTPASAPQVAPHPGPLSHSAEQLEPAAPVARDFVETAKTEEGPGASEVAPPAEPHRFVMPAAPKSVGFWHAVKRALKEIFS